jgi:hypothetical protein
MKMSKHAVTILAASVVFVSQVVVAATVAAPVKLTQVQGDVMVNNGSRFVKAVSGVELKPGAKVVTAKSSNVSLVYQNGCVKQLKQNTMHTVGTAEQCAANIGKERTYVAALGDTSLVIPANNVIINPVIIGFVGTLGTVVATQSNNDNNNNNISAE